MSRVLDRFVELGTTPGGCPWKGAACVAGIAAAGYLSLLRGELPFAAACYLVALLGSLGLATQVLRPGLLCGVKDGE